MQLRFDQQLKVDLCDSPSRMRRRGGSWCAGRRSRTSDISGAIARCLPCGHGSRSESRFDSIAGSRHLPDFQASGLVGSVSAAGYACRM
mmetsp:Transcript_134380/g.388980  ORF Transcript_134380/g.388980 Transcript_134380/m.388980 type:complete len:89 (+) Transcript_134380:225-491(+)